MINTALESEFESITGLNFPKFYKKYKPKLVWYLTKYTKDQSVAEDFADDAFIQALLKIDKYNAEKSQINTWIYKIAENLVKKDYKDKKKMAVVSLDKETSENLNLINIIPNADDEDSVTMENDKILLKKDEIVKTAISQLPEKYKRVMTLREIENKAYLDIAEMCNKLLIIELDDEIKALPYIDDLIDVKITNNSDMISYIEIVYIEGIRDCISFEIEPNTVFMLKNADIENIVNVDIISNEKLYVEYNYSTNLSTIKSQISKGRQLIKNMVTKKFKHLDDHGIC